LTVIFRISILKPVIPGDEINKVCSPYLMHVNQQEIKISQQFKSSKERRGRKFQDIIDTSYKSVVCFELK